MKLFIELGGSQTDTHCSMSSSINACGKLDFYKNNGKCKMFGVKLEYDFEEHAYKRCEKCQDAELVEVE